MTLMVLLPVIWECVSTLEYGTANAAMGVQPERAALNIEMMLVSLGDSKSIAVGIHQVVRGISWLGHHAPKVYDKHVVGA